MASLVPLFDGPKDHHGHWKRGSILEAWVDEIFHSIEAEPFESSFEKSIPIP